MIKPDKLLGGSALASLGFVNDAATSELMARFYKNLQNMDSKMTKADALRQAQRALSTQGAYRHPAYWVAFMLIGNWL